MKIFSKKYLIFIGVIIILLIIGFSFYFFIKGKKVVKEKPIPEEEVLSLSATVSSIDVKNNYLILKPANKETEVKAVLNKNTKIVKLDFPENPSPGTTFYLNSVDGKISDFKVGNRVFIKTSENIANKSEFDSIDLIEIFP